MTNIIDNYNSKLSLQLHLNFQDFPQTFNLSFSLVFPGQSAPKLMLLANLEGGETSCIHGILVCNRELCATYHCGYECDLLNILPKIILTLNAITSNGIWTNFAAVFLHINVCYVDHVEWLNARHVRL